MKITAGILLATSVLWGIACGSPAPGPPASAPAGAAAEPAHRAPHGGVLVGLDDEFAQVELVLDPAAGTLTAYVLDGEAEESVRLKQPSLKVAIEAPASGAGQTLELAARADILTGETVGDSSEFSAASPALRGATGIKGAILDLVVKGRAFRNVRF